MKHVLLVLAWIFIVPGASSQFYSFTGTIRTESGLPLIGANVSIENSFTGTVSNLNGRFSFSRLARGTYSLKISYIGYEPYSETVRLDSDLEKDFILSETSVMGEEAVITALRAGPKDPVAFSNISAEEISRMNTGRDIPSLLSMSPSLVFTSDAGNGIGYSGFRVRGSDANRINITVNGIPINDSESHGVWWVNMPDMASSVQNMQLQRGVGTSSNGAGAFGASLNIQTLALNKDPYAEIAGSYGSFNSRRNTIQAGTGLIKEKFTLDTRLSSIHSDGYIDRAFSDLSSYYISAGWHGNKSRLKLISFSGKEKTYQAWDGVPSDMLGSDRTYNGLGKYVDDNGITRFYDNQTDNYEQNNYQLHFSSSIHHYLILNTSLHYTKGAGYYEQYRENDKFSKYSLPDLIIGSETITRADLIRRKWLDNHFSGAIFSLQWNPGRLEGILGGGGNIYYGDHFGDIIWSQFTGNTDINHKWYENTGIKKDFNLYSKGTFHANETFRLYADMQVRSIDYSIEGIDDDLRDIGRNHKYFFFNPKIGWNYDIGPNQRTFFSFSVANREPNRDNFTDAKPGRPVPEFETVYDYETGYSYRNGDWSADVNLYYMDYNNQLVLTGEINDVGNPVMTNVKSSYRTGIEIISKVKLGRKAEWDANLTLSRNRIKNLVLLSDNWDYWNDPDNEEFQYSKKISSSTIGFSPSVIGSSIFRYQFHEFLTAEVHSKYIGKQYIDNSSSENKALAPYFLNDLLFFSGLKGRYVQNIDISLTIVNILNHKYSSNAWIYTYYEGGEEKYLDGYFPQAGIHFMAGLKLRFN